VATRTRSAFTRFDIHSVGVSAMMSIIHFISASRRLKESEKTVMMMGDSEAPQMLQAQKDFIKLEKDYYHEEMNIFFAYCSLFVLSLVFIFGMLVYFKVIT